MCYNTNTNMGKCMHCQSCKSTCNMGHPYGKMDQTFAPMMEHPCDQMMSHSHSQMMMNQSIKLF